MLGEAIRKISKSDSFIRYLKNSAWMLAEYLLRAVSAVFVGIYVARFLGPEQFGKLSYAIALVTVVMSATRLGMESILVRDLSRHPNMKQAYLATSFFLMTASSIFGFLFLSGFILLFEGDSQTRVSIWYVSFGVLFQALMVIDYNFQSQVKAKLSSIAKSLALSLTSMIKIYMVWEGFGLSDFAVAFALDHAAISLFLLIFHLRSKQGPLLFGFSRKLVKPLLQSSWPMVLSALAATLYMRLDQIMVKHMLDAHNLGLYSAAIKIYEGWVMIPYMIAISLLPAMVRLKEVSAERYERGMGIVFGVLFWSSVFVALLATFFGDWLIGLTFGSEFIESSRILSLVMWSAVFASLGSATGRYLIIEGKEHKIAIRTVLGLGLNACLNFVLIPAYGLEGAAYSTLLTLFFVNYAINYFDASLNQLVRICNGSITLRWLIHGK